MIPLPTPIFFIGIICIIIALVVVSLIKAIFRKKYKNMKSYKCFICNEIHKDIKRHFREKHPDTYDVIDKRVWKQYSMENTTKYLKR